MALIDIHTGLFRHFIFAKWIDLLSRNIGHLAFEKNSALIGSKRQVNYFVKYY